MRIRPKTTPERPGPWASLPAVLLAACLALTSVGCSDEPRTATGTNPATVSGDPGPSLNATCPPTGRTEVIVVDPGPFRDHQRAERELLYAMGKERRDAVDGQPPSEPSPAEQAGGDGAKAEPSRAKAKAASRTKPAPKARRSGPWTIAMAPSTFPKGSLERARDQFMHFTGAWLERIRANMRFSDRKAEIVAVPGQDAFLARFSRLEADTRQIEVKPTKTPGCPFVGVLKYLEHTYEARGNSPDTAASGPFKRVKTVRVTEIFSYAGDAWVH